MDELIADHVVVILPDSLVVILVRKPTMKLQTVVCSQSRLVFDIAIPLTLLHFPAPTRPTHLSYDFYWMI